MIVLPTLGERLPSLELALDSCLSIPTNISSTVFLVSPSQATEARALGATYGAVIVEDPGSGMAGAITPPCRPVGITPTMSGWGMMTSWWGRYCTGRCGPRTRFTGRRGPRVLRLHRRGRPFDRAQPGWKSRAVSASVGAKPHSAPRDSHSIRCAEASRRFFLGYSYALDLDVFLRLRKQGRFLAVPAVTARFRWHPNSLTVADRKASSREAMAIKSQYLPGWLRWASPLWHQPVAWASAFAAGRLNGRALKGKA